jgi:hypothetical protein
VLGIGLGKVCVGLGLGVVCVGCGCGDGLHEGYDKGLGCWAHAHT